MGAEMQMDVRSEHATAHEAFLLPSAGKRVMNAIDTTQRIVSDDAGAMKTVTTNLGSLFPKQTIVRELHIGVSEMNQGFGHLDSDGKDACHGITVSFDHGQFFSQVHQPATFGINWLVGIRKCTHLMEQAAIAA